MAFLTTLYAPNYPSLADRSHIFHLLNVYMALITLFADLKSLGSSVIYECKRTMKLIGVLTDSDGAELTPQNEQEKTEIRGQRVDHEMDTEWTRNGHGMDTLGTAPIISTRVDAKENRDKRIGDKENKRFNPDWLVDKGPIKGEIEACQPASLDETIGRTDESFLTAESSWKDYLDKLKVDSKESQCLLENAYQDAAFFEQNFNKFKLKLLNRAKHQPKSKHKLPQDVTNVSPQTLLMFPLR